MYCINVLFFFVAGGYDGEVEGDAEGNHGGAGGDVVLKLVYVECSVGQPVDMAGDA